MHGKRTGETSGMTLSFKEPGQKLRLQAPLPQQSSSSAGEEEGHWVVMEDRRRRRIAFENLAKEMLRCLGNSDDVKVVLVQICISVQQVAQQEMNENGQKIFEVFWQEKE